MKSRTGKSALKIAKAVAAAASGKKAVDIAVINVRSFTIVSEYFVVMTATSEPHRKTLVDEIEKSVEDSFGLRPVHSEGKKFAGWTVLDYGGVMVHIFLRQSREMYGLEKLYHGARKIKYKE